LRSFLEDGLPELEHAELADHLETCSACRRTLERLAAGSRLWADLRQLAAAPGPRPQTVSGDDTETFGAPHPAGRAADRDETLNFLAPSITSGSLGRLGPYEVTEVLGRGGFGVVLKGFDPALGRTVAIKVLA